MHSLVYASRGAWREGIRTFVASNGTQTDAVLLHGPESLRGTPLYAKLQVLFVDGHTKGRDERSLNRSYTPRATH